MSEIYERCGECGNAYYFTIHNDKVVCDVCLSKNKVVEVKVKA